MAFAAALALTAAAALVILQLTKTGRAPPYFGQFAGYVWRGNVRSVRGSWTVPRVLTGSPSGLAGTWIGAQAQSGTRPFIQIGSNEQRSSVGDRYYAFWSDTRMGFHPRSLFAIHAGDELSASLRLTDRRWALAIVDASTGASAHLSTADETGTSFDEAEWTQEDPRNGHTGKIEDYPRLGPIVFSGLAVDASRPVYPALYTTWMSLGSENLAPSPLREDSFTLRQAKVSAAGHRYLRIATPEDAATEAFIDSMAKWNLKSPRAQLATARRTLTKELEQSTRALARASWPATARTSIELLRVATRLLLRQTRAPVPATTPGIWAWREQWSDDAQKVGDCAHVVKRLLDVPEIRPEST